MGKLIFSAAPEAADLALGELRGAAPDSRIVKWPEPGVCMLSAAEDFAAVSAGLVDAQPVFVRHIAPADLQADSAAALVPMVLPLLRKDGSFSVQVRASGERAPERAALTAQLGSALEAAGFRSDRAHPECVVSVYMDGGLWAGVSAPAQNLSAWPGGMIRFAFRADTVCRAEFKLLEVLDTCPCRLPTGGVAVDLGAAPGGWTRILAQRGFAVSAVDPAELHPAVKALPGVTHWRCTAQEYLQRQHGQADLIVNDMKMDVGASAGLMCECAPLLAQGGSIVMSFKLPSDKWGKRIKNGLDILERAYRVCWVKQLFHNRSEVTVVGIKK